MSSILGKLFVLMALFPHELIARVQKGAETTLVRRALAPSIRDDKPTNEMVRRLIPPLCQEDGGGSF